MVLLSREQAPAPSVSWRPAGVGHDGEQHVAAGGHEPRAGRKIERAPWWRMVFSLRCSDCLAGIARVVEKRVGGLVALDVDDAEDLALLDLPMRPVGAGLDDLAVNGVRTA